jgi:hypothetical protein
MLSQGFIHIVLCVSLQFHENEILQPVWANHHQHVALLSYPILVSMAIAT